MIIDVSHAHNFRVLFRNLFRFSLLQNFEGIILGGQFLFAFCFAILLFQNKILGLYDI